MKNCLYDIAKRQIQEVISQKPFVQTFINRYSITMQHVSTIYKTFFLCVSMGSQMIYSEKICMTSLYFWIILFPIKKYLQETCKLILGMQPNGYRTVRTPLSGNISDFGVDRLKATTAIACPLKTLVNKIAVNGN